MSNLYSNKYFLPPISFNITPNTQAYQFEMGKTIAKNLEDMRASAEKINKCLLTHSDSSHSNLSHDHLSDTEFTDEYIKYIIAKNNITTLPSLITPNMPNLLVPIVSPNQSIDPSESALYYIVTPQNPPLLEHEVESLKQDFGAMQKHKYIGSHDRAYKNIDFSSEPFVSKVGTFLMDSASTIKHAFSNINLSDFANSKAAGIAVANAGGWMASETAGMVISALTTVAYTTSSLKESWDEVQKEKVRKEINGVAFNHQNLFPDHETLNEDNNNNLTIGALNKKLKLMNAQVYQTTQYSTSTPSLT